MPNDNKVVIEFVADTSQLDTANKQVQQDLITTGKVGTQAFNDFNKANQQVEQSTKNISDQFRELTKTIAAGVIEEVGVAAKEASLNFLSLRTQLANAKDGLQKLAEQGKKNSKEYEEQIKLVEKLSMANRKLNKEVQDLGSHTKVFSGLIESVRGVAAGFEVAKSASMVFGASQEQAEQAIKQLIPVMAALQGLQELQIITSEESAAVALVEKGQRLASAAAVQLETAVKSENVIVSKAATAAQWALNVAMEANPIMVIVGALGAAVAALLYFTSTTKEADEETVKFNEDMQKLNDTIQNDYVKRMRLTGELNESEAKAIEINTRASKESLKVLQETAKAKEEIAGKYSPEKQAEEEAKIFSRQTEKLKAIELDRQLQLYNVKLEFLERGQELEADRLEKVKRLRDEAAKAAADANKKYFDELLKQSDIEWEELKKQRDERYAQQIQDAKNNYAALQKIKSNRADELQFIEDFYNKQYEIEHAFNTMSFEDFQEWEKKKRKEYKETEDEAKRLMNETTKEEERIQAEKTALIQQGAKAAIQIAQTVADTIFTIERNNRAASLQADLSMLDKKKEHELSNKHNTSAQIDAINRKYARIEAAAKLKAWKADQDAAATQAGIKMALGVVNAWATSSSWIQALIVSAAVLATGAAEIAVIKSQKPPQFAAGTEYLQRGSNPTGVDTIPILANEGERIVPTHINEQLKGVANEDLPGLVQAALYSPMPHAPEEGGVNVVIEQKEIDYKKMAKAFGEELKSHPQVVMNIDKGGFSLSLIDKQRSVERLNNRYASK